MLLAMTKLRQRKAARQAHPSRRGEPPAQQGAAKSSNRAVWPPATCDASFAALCATVFVLAIVVHWHIVFNAHDWVYDDGSVIEDNPMLRGDPVKGPQQPLSQLLYTDYWGTPMTHNLLSHLSFRPFTSLTFRLQAGWHAWDISHASPFMRAVHIFDLMAHALVSVLLMVAVRSTLRLDVHVAGGIGLLFATHPVHVEAVCNCTSRAEMLYSLAVLVAWLAFFEADKLIGGPLHRLAGMPEPLCVTMWTRLSVPVLCVCQGIACASKEQGIFFVCMTTAFLLIQLLVLYRAPVAGGASHAGRRVGGRVGVACTIATTHAALWACTFANILWRGYVSGSRLIPSYSYTMNPLPYLGTTTAKVLTALSFHVEAFRLMLLPTLQPMRCDYKDLPAVVEVADPRNIWAGLLYAVILGLGIALGHGIWVHSAAAWASPAGGAAVRTSPFLVPAVFFFGLLVTFYLPSSNAIGYVGFHVAERVLYFPSAGVIGLACLLLRLALQTVVPGAHGGPGVGSRAAAMLFWVAILGLVAAFSAATVARVPAWTSTYNLWAADWENYPQNPTVRGSHATEEYLNHGQDRDRLLVAMEHIVDSAGMVSDSQATTDHVTRIAERLAGLGASKAAVAALDRALMQNTDIMRDHAADLARGVIRVDQRWARNRPGYPHIQNCNYLRSKGLSLMIGSGDKAGGNAEYPTTQEQLAAKQAALAAFEEAVATCKEMRRTSSTELYPTSTDRETVTVLMMAARASRELQSVDVARRHLEDCVAVCKRNRDLRGGREQQRCELMISQL